MPFSRIEMIESIELVLNRYLKEKQSEPLLQYTTKLLGDKYSGDQTDITEITFKENMFKIMQIIDTLIL